MGDVPGVQLMICRMTMSSEMSQASVAAAGISAQLLALHWSSAAEKAWKVPQSNTYLYKSSSNNVGDP